MSMSAYPIELHRDAKTVVILNPTRLLLSFHAPEALEALVVTLASWSWNWSRAAASSASPKS